MRRRCANGERERSGRVGLKSIHSLLEGRSIAIIAEGIPENMTRQIINVAEEKKVNIIGPATVGGVKPGCFKIGNTGGMMDNILHSKLYRHVGHSVTCAVDL